MLKEYLIWIVILILFVVAVRQWDENLNYKRIIKNEQLIANQQTNPIFLDEPCECSCN